MLQEHRGVLDRDGALSVRHAARSTRSKDFPAEHARPAAAEPLLEPVDRRLVAAARRGGLHGDGVARRCSSTRRGTRTRCCSTATRRAAIRSRAAATEPPFAYVVPQEQRDPVAAVELLRRLAFGGVRVSQLTAPATIDGVTYPAGTWVIPIGSGVRRDGARSARRAEVSRPARVSRRSARAPVRRGRLDAAAADGRAGRRRDDAARRRRAREDEALGRAPSFEGGADAVRHAATADAAPFDSVPGVGFDTESRGRGHRAAGRQGHRHRARRCVVDPAQNNAFRAINRAWKAGGAVQFVAAGDRRARYVITGVDRRGAQPSWSTSLALQAERAAAPRGVAVKKPRIGLYQPWTAAWTKAGRAGCSSSTASSTSTLTPADFTAPSRSPIASTSLILADEARGRSMRRLRGAGAVPPRSSTGGIGADGVRALDAFVRGGGTLVCFNRGSLFAIEQLKLPVKNVVAGVEAGGVLRRRIDPRSRGRRPAQPVMAGMPERAAVFVDGSPVFETARRLHGHGAGALSGRPARRCSPATDRREVPERQGRGARRAARRGPRRPARLPAAVARPALRHVPGDLQRGAGGRRPR